MTQEDKELLLKDLCARLPYKVMFQCKYYDGPVKMYFIDTDYIGVEYRINGKFFLHEIKPYLRPMSNMTKAEKEYVEELSEFRCTPDVARSKIDFYLEHHIDFRGLIPKGLALEAPEGMYKID